MRATRRDVLIGSTAAAAAVALPRAGRALAQDKTTVEWWHISQNDPGKTAFQDSADAYMAANPDVEDQHHHPREPGIQGQADHGHAVWRCAGHVPELGWRCALSVRRCWFGPGHHGRSRHRRLGRNDQCCCPGLYANEGKNYGVPWQMGIVGMWYNKAHFATAAIEATPTYWTELLDAVDKLKAADIVPITVGEGDKWPGHFWWVYLAIRHGGKAAFDAA